MRAHRILATLALTTAVICQSAPLASQPSVSPPQPTPPVATTSHAMTAADYPAESLRMGEEGTVAVRYLVGETGDVMGCAVTTSSGHPRLDDAACAFVSKWKYQPATLDGQATQATITANVVFQPRREPGPFNDGVEAAQRGDFATALMHWRPLAEAGVPEGQAALGSLYVDGRGVPQNAELAAQWFRLAAEQGFAPAQTALGQFYATGRGVPLDPVEAAKWFERSAQQGNARAQMILGMLYQAGRGVQRDDAKAAEWLRLAAAQGEAQAQFNLGMMYKAGTGVAQDPAEAMNSFRLSAQHGNAAAQVVLGEAYAAGSGTPQDLGEAVRWYRTAAEQGNAVGQLRLGQAYLEGKGIAENPVKALMWFWVGSAASIPDEPTRFARADAERARDELRGRMSPAQAGQAMQLAFTCPMSKFKDCDGTVQPAAASTESPVDPATPIVSAEPVGSQAMMAEDYPVISIRLQEQGTVGVRFIVSAEGTVRDCTVALSSGKPRLDEAACAMVTRRWLYRPAVQNGVPIESVHDASVVFSLR